MPRQNASPSEHPQAVLQEIERLAQHIVVARKRRGETQAQWARKLGVSQPTMARIERGDPSVAMASYVMCLWLINPSMGLADLVAPEFQITHEISVASYANFIQGAIANGVGTGSDVKANTTELNGIADNADALVARVQKGESLATVAAADGLRFNELPGLRRGMPMPTAEANEAIFAAGRPAEGKVVAGKVALGDGAYAIFTVNKVTDGAIADMPPEERASMQQQLVQLNGGIATQAYVDALRKRFKVKVFEERL